MKTLLIIAFSLLSTLSHADTVSEIKQLIADNLKYTQAEDLNAVMSTMHSQSPSLLPTRKTLQQLFPLYEVKYQLNDVSFVGADDKYAYAKVIQTTTKISGPAFQNNRIEALQIFKKENNQWKLWAQANLEIKFLP